jgi:hypothetical protein
MELHCHFCGLSKFRTSHFRFHPADLSRLLLLRLPVRCLNCDERTFTSIRQYLEVRRVRRARRRVRSSGL